MNLWPTNVSDFIHFVCNQFYTQPFEYRAKMHTIYHVYVCYNLAIVFSESFKSSSDYQKLINLLRDQKIYLSRANG